MTQWASGPAATRLRLGAELRRLRDAAGLKLEDVARVLECSPSKISRLEIGKGLPRTRDVRDLLELYDVADAERRDRLITWSRGGQAPGWWNHYADVLPESLSIYVELEWDATRIEAFEPYLIHGLLQTRDYARALLVSAHEGQPDDWIERLIDQRLHRQEALTSDHGLTMSCVLDESTLLRVVGSGSIMRSQLDHLLGLAEADHVEVRVLPFAAGPVAASAFGSFAQLKFSESVGPDVVFRERITGDELITAPEVVGFYAAKMDRLDRSAYSSEESRAAIKNAHDRLV